MNFIKSNKAIISILSLFIIFSIVMLLEYKYYLGLHYKEKITEQNSQYKNKILLNEYNLNSLLNDILHDSNVHKSFINANSNINKNIEENRLYQTYKSRFKLMKKIGVSEFNFYLANGDLFLKFNKDKIYKENKRLEAKTMTYGYSVKKDFEGFKYIYPIFQNKRYLGSIEISFDSSFFLNQMNTNSKEYYSIILKKELYKNENKTSCINDAFVNINKKYSSPFCNKLTKYSIDRINENILNNKAFSLLVSDKNRKTNIVTFTNIQNLEKENIGYLISIKKDNSIYFIQVFNIIKFIIVIILLIILHKLYTIVNQKSFEIKQILQAIDKTTLISKSNRKGKITYVSNAFCKVSGYAKDELIGKNHNIIRDLSMDKHTFKDMWKTIKSKKIWNGVITNRKKDGTRYVVNSTILPLLDNRKKIKEFIAIRHDITELENYKNLLTTKVNEYSDIIDKYVIISTTDIKGKITYVSEAFSTISGYSKEELLGSKHNIIRHSHMKDKVFKEMWKTISSGKTWKGEVKNRKKDNTFYWVYAIISPIFNSENKITGYSAIRQDITDKKLIEEISQKDKLTQIYNRVKLDEVLLTEIERSKRYNTDFSIILLDIDKFKSINDNFGHPVGDSVLKETANLLKSNLRKTDIVGRWGGEEFLIICTNTKKDGCIQLAENLRKKMEDFSFSTVKNVTASFGVTTYTKNDFEESLLNRCDKALYEAKENGRNIVRDL